MSFDLKIMGGDLVISGGDFQQVVDSEKLLQDILKIAQTPAGANPSFSWYGSYISRSLIGSYLDASITAQMGQSQLQNAVQILMQLQASQVKSGQSVSADEQIKSILDISVNRSTTDLTSYYVTIRVLSKGFKTVNASFQISNL